MKETIVVLSLTQCYGGGEKSIEVLIREWALKHRVIVFAEDAAHLQTLRQITGNEIEIFGAVPGKSAISLVRNVLLLARITGRFPPTLLVANSNKASMVLALWSALKFGRIPPVGIYLRSFGWSYLDFILRLLPKATVLVPSKYVLEHPAYKSTRLSQARTMGIPNAVTSSHTEPDFGGGEWVGCVARITRWKGLHYLLNALATAVLQAPGIQLKVLGNVHEPDYYSELQEQVSQLGLKKNVEFLEFTNKTDDFFRQSRFLVISSTSDYDGPETFSRVIIEAWSHARPSISFAVGGPKYLINHGVDGLLVEEKDTDALAAGMLQLWQDASLCEQMGKAGLENIHNQFSAGQIAAKVIKAIRE